MYTPPWNQPCDTIIETPNQASTHKGLDVDLGGGMLVKSYKGYTEGDQCSQYATIIASPMQFHSSNTTQM